jgi:hypothetical protein
MSPPAKLGVESARLSGPECTRRNHLTESRCSRGHIFCIESDLAAGIGISDDLVDGRDVYEVHNYGLTLAVTGQGR